jgi:imidazolonepropionase-like amidohydrolase
MAQPPAPNGNAKKVAIVGGTYHIGNGSTVIENGYLVLDKGKIVSIGKLPFSSSDTIGAKLIQANGRHIYPGFTLLNTSIGLIEVGAVRATQDKYEAGSVNSNARSIIAYNAESELIYTARYNGILSAQIVPRGGLVSGQSSLVQFDAWNWEDAAVKADEGLHVNWPSKYGASEDPEQRNVFKESVKKQTSELEKLFVDAKSYAAATNPVANFKLDPIVSLLTGKRNFYVHANYAGDMVDAVNFFQRLGVTKIAIIGGYESYAIVGFLRENKVSVILNKIHQLPISEDEDISLPYRLPKILADSGVVFALGYDYEEHSARNLAFLAGTASAYGLDKEKALAAITSVPAQIIGIGSQQGTLEKGKDATLFISKGNALDMQGNVLIHAFIQGREIILDNKQVALFRKYGEKYGLI